MKNLQRAVANATIVTVASNGQRIIRTYQSGEPLVGRIPQDDAPPFTGFVRGFGSTKKGSRK